MNDMVREHGKVRTDLWCHECRNDFSVALDYDLDGNHVVHCPHCNHQHFRVIVAGVVTDVRWASSMPGYSYTLGSATSTGSVWRTVTSTAATNATGNYFLYDMWNRGMTTS